MSYYDNGCSSYIKTQATVVNYFPVDSRGTADIACNYCRYFGSRRCSLTGEVVPYPNKYVGRECPLTPVENEEEK